MESILKIIAIAVSKFLELFKVNGLTVFHKQKDHCVFSSLNLFAPTLVAYETKETLGHLEDSINFSLSFDTAFTFSKSKNILCINARVLGFGFGFIKQEGY